MVITTTDTVLQKKQSFTPENVDGCLLEPDYSGPTFTKCLPKPDYSGPTFTKCLPKPNATQCQDNYRIFPSGDYLYNFEFVVDGSLPETIKTDLGSVKYNLEAYIEPSGRFCSTLVGELDIPIVRLPAENSLELIEPVTISLVWRDKLHCKATILGKAFPLGSQIPINLKMIPTANLVCHWIKVYVTEHVQHWMRGKGARRVQLPTKRVLLFEKQGGLESASTYAGSEIRISSEGRLEPVGNSPTVNNVNKNTNLLGAIPSDVEIDLKVQLPSCHEMKRREKLQCLHFDTEVESLKVNHWIQVVLRFSNLDNGDPSWNKPVDMTLESPFHILSCKATPANIFVPAYETHPGEPIDVVQQRVCACPGPDASRPISSEQDTNIQEQLSSNHVNQLPFNGSTLSLESSNNGSGTKSSDIKQPPRAYLGEINRDDIRSLRISRRLS